MYSVAPPPEAVSALTVYPGTKVQSQWLRDQTDREACEQGERRHAPNTRCQRKYRYDHHPLQTGAQHQLQQRRPRRHHTAAQRDIRGQSASRHHTSSAHKHRQRSGPARNQENQRYQCHSGHLVGRRPQYGAATSSDRIQHAAHPGVGGNAGVAGPNIVFVNENHPAKPQKYSSPRFCGATAVNPGQGRRRQARTIDPVAKNEFPSARRGSKLSAHPSESPPWGRPPVSPGCRSVAFAADYAMTGRLWVGGALEPVEPASNIVAFHVHEDVHKKVWRRIETRGCSVAMSAGRELPAVDPGPFSAPATLLPRRPSATAGSEAPAPSRGFVFARIATPGMTGSSCRTPRGARTAPAASAPKHPMPPAGGIVHRAGPEQARNAVCTFTFPSSNRIGNGP